jgi:hypothetical protein
MRTRTNALHSLGAVVCAGGILLLAVYSPAQNLFEADFASGNIYEFTPQGVQTTFASGLGPAMPFDLAFNQAGDLFLTEYQSSNIYVFTPGGVQGTFPASGLSFPRGMVFDQGGNLFVGDPGNGNIYKFTPGGVQTTFASGLNPWGLAINQVGDLFEADPQAGVINEFTPNGVQTTFASGLGSPIAMAFDQAGDMFVADQSGGNIYEFTTSGVQSTFASGLTVPSGLAFDRAGDLFEADQGGSHIFEFLNINGTLSSNATLFASSVANPIGLAFWPVPGPSATPSQGQFLWSERIASINTTWPSGEPNVGLALDTNDNCYVTGWFDDINNFGGVTLTNQSTGGGSDVFVAKYNSTGALQWVQRAGGTAGGQNNGRGIGVDTNGNIYVVGGYYGSATFGSHSLPTPVDEGFFITKYNNTGAVQWAKSASGVYGDLYGIGLTVDAGGNSYALAFDDADDGATVSFGSAGVAIPSNDGECTILVKYNNAGTAQWVQLLGSSNEVYATKVAVDSSGNVYVRGILEGNLTIGSSNLVVSPADSQENGFIAKFNNSGTLTWVRQITGENVNEGGVAVDLASNVFITGGFSATANFGNGIILTNTATNALFGDAFVAKYNSSGAIQWAQEAGGTNGGFYWDVALDGQTNVYPTGFLGSEAAVAKYNASGTSLWTYTAGGLPENPVSSLVGKCAVDTAGRCYLDGWYQGYTTFGTNTLQPQEAWNFFLSEVIAPPPQLAILQSASNVIMTWPTSVTGFTLQSSTNLSSAVWSTVTPSPVVVNGQNTVTNPISGTQRFYRLSQ